MKGKNKLKGSVLFTVVAVMMVTLVFIMSALTIAGATSRRAYSDYAKDQTQYTARTAIEATVRYLNDNEDFQNLVEKMAKNETKNVTIQFPDTAKGIGSIDVQIKCQGKDSATGEDIVTITATSGLLDDETSVVAYISKIPPSSPTSPFNNAMTSMGNAKINNNISIYGGSAINVIPDYDTLPASVKPYYADRADLFSKLDNFGFGSYSTDIDNSGDLEGQIFVNGQAIIKTNLRFLFTKQQDSLIVNGNYIEQNTAEFESTVAVSSLNNVNQLPYIYADGTFYSYSQNPVGTADNPINVYCKNLVLASGREGRKFCGDIFAFGTDDDYDTSKAESYFSSHERYEWDSTEGKMNLRCETARGAISSYECNNSTPLLAWTNKVLNSTDGQTYCGGSFYSNGSIYVSGNCQLSVAKNMYVNQGMYSKKNVTIGSATDADSGILYVKGKLIIDGGEMKVNKLYFNEIEIKSGKIIVGGTDYTSTDAINNAVGTDANVIKVNSGSDSIKWSYSDSFTKDGLLMSNGGFVANKQRTAAKYYGDLTTGGKGFYNMKHAPASCSDTIYVFNGSNVTGYEKIASGETGSFNFDGTNIVSASGGAYKQVLNESLSTFSVKKDCTFLGGCQNDNLIVDPTSQDIAIKLVNFYLNNNSKIIVDDSARDTTTKLPLHSATFFSETDINFYNNNMLITKTYYDNLSSNLYLKQNPQIGNIDQTKYIPNVYMYLEKDVNLTAINGTLFTAYIFAPECLIKANTTHNFGTIKYNDATAKSNGAYVIGSVVCDNIDVQNIGGIYFINPDGTGLGGGMGASGGSYRVLYYNND